MKKVRSKIKNKYFIYIYINKIFKIDFFFIYNYPHNDFAFYSTKNEDES